MNKTTFEEAARLLCETGWLASRTPVFRKELLKHAALKRFTAGQVIFRHGEEGGGIYGLVCGTLTFNSAPPNTIPRLVHFGAPGIWAGEGCFITGEPRRGEMRSLGGAWMMHVPLHSMRHMAATDPRMIQDFAAISFTIMDTLIRIVHDLQMRSASRRIAAVLERSAWLTGRAIPLSQSDLAVMSNTSRAQVNSAIRDFEDKGWVEHSYRSVTVTDIESLRSYVSGEDLE